MQLHDFTQPYAYKDFRKYMIMYITILIATMLFVYVTIIITDYARLVTKYGDLCWQLTRTTLRDQGLHLNVVHFSSIDINNDHLYIETGKGKIMKSRE